VNNESAIAATWPTLVRSAVVGTQRSPAIGLLSEEAEWTALIRGGTSSDETLVLRAAAVIGLLRRAGRRAPLVDRAEAPPAGPETRPRCGPAAAADLLRILDHEPGLLPEWLALAERAQVRVPEEHVPLLFSYAESRAALHPAVIAVAGARGAWLGTQFSEWGFAAGTPDDPGAAWLHGEFAARLAAFVMLRRIDPADARERLIATWEREAARERVAFVRALHTGLGDADEPFLDARLDDRRKDVREAAALLLARLPASRLAARATAAAHACITLRKRLLQSPVLDVTLPEALSAELQRDVIDLKPPHGVGERAWMLRQIVAHVPPAQLVPGVDAAHVLDLVRRCEHGPALLHGIAAATASYDDERMRTAFLIDAAGDHGAGALALTANQDAPWSERRRDAIVALLEAGVPNALEFTLTLPGPWDRRFSQAFLAYLRALATSSAGSALWRTRREVFSEAALRIEPALADAGEEWPASATQEIARDVIDAFYETVRFRAGLRRHLESQS